MVDFDMCSSPMLLVGNNGWPHSTVAWAEHTTLALRKTACWQRIAADRKFFGTKVPVGASHVAE
jgi:hypothetical protein